MNNQKINVQNISISAKQNEYEKLNDKNIN